MFISRELIAEYALAAPVAAKIAMAAILREG
jgi:hypothetical protein